MVRHRHTPYSARRELGIEPDYGVCGLPNNPDWCFDRMGMTTSELSDGRQISIAGEHEDFYHPDFCIYNDVVVQQGDEVSIYGYPRDVFPPTDFHTATVIGGAIWIVGALGYRGQRGPETQALVLNTSTYAVQRMQPRGCSPGWIHKHRAVLMDDGVTIELSKGIVVCRTGDAETCRKNLDVFRLDTQTLTWSKATDTSLWRQYRIVYEQRVEDMARGRDLGWHTGEILTQLGLRVDPRRTSDAPEDEDRAHTVWIRDIPVRIEDSYQELSVVVEGDLPEADRQRLLSGLSALMESTKRKVTKVVEC